DGFDVGGVGELRVGHDRGRVGVDEDDPQALLLQHAAGLGARVVELRGLADDDGAGADDENTGEIGTTWHQASLRNESSKWWASESPAPSSGWNWSPATGCARATKPSAEPSLRLTWVISTSGLPAKSTVKEGVWEVMSTCTLSGACTGWLAPWWGRRSGSVANPRARARIW